MNVEAVPRQRLRRPMLSSSRSSPKSASSSFSASVTPSEYTTRVWSAGLELRVDEGGEAVLRTPRAERPVQAWGERLEREGSRRRPGPSSGKAPFRHRLPSERKIAPRSVEFLRERGQTIELAGYDDRPIAAAADLAIPIATP